MASRGRGTCPQPTAPVHHCPQVLLADGDQLRAPAALGAHEDEQLAAGAAAPAEDAAAHEVHAHPRPPPSPPRNLWELVLLTRRFPRPAALPPAPWSPALHRQTGPLGPRALVTVATGSSLQAEVTYGEARSPGEVARGHAAGS
ncbi:uncharacterized protein C3orf22 homolog isoform X2 [Ovis aries]|uniref:uncharacterized protein C3orf22 homolog isoform X2 n=1 Tax=Ovis aries TaxID=9940 RepID=UPI001C2E4CAC|nr:uncharacterized protein C3orf22 homolog isoform X2 [Ovis aries]